MALKTSGRDAVGAKGGAVGAARLLFRGSPRQRGRLDLFSQRFPIPGGADWWYKMADMVEYLVVNESVCGSLWCLSRAQRSESVIGIG